MLKILTRQGGTSRDITARQRISSQQVIYSVVRTQIMVQRVITRQIYYININCAVNIESVVGHGTAKNQFLASDIQCGSETNLGSVINTVDILHQYKLCCKY